MSEHPDFNSMVTVPIDHLKSGMLLAKDLRGINGRLILEKGTCLTTKLLRIIRMWGITEAPILESGIIKEEPGLLKEPVTLEPQMEDLVKELFRFTNYIQEPTQSLYRLFKLNISKKGMSPRHRPDAGQLQPENLKKSTEPDIRKRLEQEVKLPSLPDMVVRITEAINNPTCTSTHIADIIVKDSSLTARLLKLVNSAFYNFPMPIDSIPRAVTIIGSKQLSELALGTAVISAFEQIPSDVADMRSFWKHSVACGIISRLIAGYRNSSNTESYFLAGLLHDMGRLLFYLYFPLQAKQILYHAYSPDQPRLLHLVETETVGLDHGELGALLIKQWKLPTILEFACHYHHHPMKAPDPVVASIVHTADIIANAMQMGSSGSYYVPPLDSAAWEELSISPHAVPQIVQQTERILEDTVKTYFDEPK